MSIHIGLNARLFPGNWRPARDEIRFAAAAGFESIQFPGPESGLDAERLGDKIPAIAQELRQARLTAVMEMLIFINEDGRTDGGQTPLDVLRANLPALQGLPCRFVHWHLASRTVKDEAVQSRLEAALVDQMRTAVAVANKHGFVFGFEHNAPQGLFDTPDRCKSLLDAVPGLWFVWDVNHTTSEHLDGFLALTSRMSHLHISDTPLPAVNHHLPLGLGTINFEHYVAELLKRGFHGPAILEIGGLPLSGGYGRDTDETLVDSRQRLAGAIERAGA